MCLNEIRNIVKTCKCVILDIEGTTTSIDFVKKELFPYAEKYLEDYIKNHWNDDEMKEIVNLCIKEQNLFEQEEGFVPLPAVPSESGSITNFQDALISYLHWQMACDFKATALKRLQGYIWTSGYNSGQIYGHVYEDVPLALKYWKSAEKKIYIYSSGSIQAQKLLFQNSVQGNLDQFIDGNFDTEVGSKILEESYSKIAKEINENPENIVFFTDRPKEVLAAKRSGMKVILMVRDQHNHFLKSEEKYIGEEDGTLDSFLPLLK